MSRLRVNRFAGLIAAAGLMFSFVACGEVQIVEVQKVITVEVEVPVEKIVTRMVVATPTPTEMPEPMPSPTVASGSCDGAAEQTYMEDFLGGRVLIVNGAAGMEELRLSLRENRALFTHSA